MFEKQHNVKKKKKGSKKYVTNTTETFLGHQCTQDKVPVKRAASPANDKIVNILRNFEILNNSKSKVKKIRKIGNFVWDQFSTQLKLVNLNN